MEHLKGVSLWNVPGLPTSTILALKDLQGTNTLAFCKKIVFYSRKKFYKIGPRTFLDDGVGTDRLERVGAFLNRDGLLKIVALVVDDEAALDVVDRHAVGVDHRRAVLLNLKSF